MAQGEDETKDQTEPVSELAISYRGTDAKADAESLSRSLQASGLRVEPLAEVGKGDAMLGASEIIITIILAPIAQAAAKAVISTALNHLKDYFVERVKNGSADIDGQLVVREPTSSRDKRFPFSLRQATAQTIKQFFENVDAAI